MAGQWKIQILCSPSLRKSTSWLPDPTKCAFMAKNQKSTSFSAFSSTLKPPLSRVHIQLPWVGYLGGCVWLKTNKSKLAAELDFLPHLIAKCKRQLSKKKIEFLRYNIRFLFHLCLAYMQHHKSTLPKCTQPNQCIFYIQNKCQRYARLSPLISFERKGFMKKYKWRGERRLKWKLRLGLF